ncbi:fasciclin domain-containing protein [Pontibacter sp. HSC-36F09]|uniref:fasciclin domain-containing protein n=1 Tax=Pontibacter sp. HSC-36F09 TaxID=2910966 RepID=UPI00209CAD8C|nr:fasciclin domain-containing protein [Pontibacter sp. HSC-36F09]MCP2044403.1 putative surface protein with fasciclin (FAS1) repeats [Pontibacter sp. HSC-36F09]
MKKLSILFLSALFLYGCNTNEQATESEEVVTTDTEMTTGDDAMTTDETMATDDATTAGSQDIVALASETPSLSTLVQALQAADLVGALQGAGPYTVFAPTNEAFAALPAGTLENLLKPENKQQLVDILTYHVVEGNVKSTDLSNNMSAKTLNSAELKVMLNGSSVKINDANVTMADVEASNGVVHVIDKVMLPPTK